jgi:hypothetical protein
MKAILLLSFMIVSISCVQENKPVNTNPNSLSQSQEIKDNKEPVTEGDTQTVSVVKPIFVGKRISVGGTNADIHGYTSEAIQTAIDASARNL